MQNANGLDHQTYDENHDSHIGKDSFLFTSESVGEGHPGRK